MSSWVGKPIFTFGCVFLFGCLDWSLSIIIWNHVLSSMLILMISLVDWMYLHWLSQLVWVVLVFSVGNVLTGSVDGIGGTVDGLASSFDCCLGFIIRLLFPFHSFVNLLEMRVHRYFAFSLAQHCFYHFVVVFVIWFTVLCSGSTHDCGCRKHQMCLCVCFQKEHWKAVWKPNIFTRSWRFMFQTWIVHYVMYVLYQCKCPSPRSVLQWWNMICSCLPCPLKLRFFQIWLCSCFLCPQCRLKQRFFSSGVLMVGVYCESREFVSCYMNFNASYASTIFNYICRVAADLMDIACANRYWAEGNCILDLIVRFG